jgi:hypothetical protein
VDQAGGDELLVDVEPAGDEKANDARDEVTIETREVFPMIRRLCGNRGNQVVGYEVERAGEFGEVSLAVAVRAPCDEEGTF